MSRPNYCGTSGISAMAGKDILLMIYDNSDNLVAVSGQKSLTINRSADSIEISTKTSGGWKNSVAGLKSWSIDIDGLYAPDDDSIKSLNNAFNDSESVCLVVKNIKTGMLMFGGNALITDFPVEAPEDDSVTFSMSLTGNGELVDLSALTVNPDMVELEKPTSGSATATVNLLGVKGTVTAGSGGTGVTATVSGDVATITVTSSATAGLHEITFTDTLGEDTWTAKLKVIVYNAQV